MIPATMAGLEKAMPVSKIKYKGEQKCFCEEGSLREGAPAIAGEGECVTIKFN